MNIDLLSTTGCVGRVSTTFDYFVRYSIFLKKTLGKTDLTFFSNPQCFIPSSASDIKLNIVRSVDSGM